MSRLDQFAANLRRSGLMPRDAIDRARARLPAAGADREDDAVRLARLLIEEGALTPYQARKVLAGATKGFFLGGFRILRQLGEGGMGKVYLAARDGEPTRVAIKVLPPKKAAEEEQALVRFRREMDLSRRLRHPNIARTLDVGHEDGAYFMVMEYIPGHSLYHVVKTQGALSVPVAADYMLKVLDGLAAAHAAGLVHRDIKPSNLMITPDGDAKILDLGLAKALGEESGVTKMNVVIGTLDYASPEQLSDAARADTRSDLYSLGCTLYFTLAGRPPFEGGDVINKIYRQRMEDPEPLERVARGVPAAFAAIVRTLMAKEPDHRYQSTEEVAADLARWTDPAAVVAVLGAEAESARSFRFPPPELDEDDLRLFDDDDAPPPSFRGLDDPEPAPAPYHRAPDPPRPAIYSPSSYRSSSPARHPASESNAAMMTLLAVLLLAGLIILVLALVF
ncbi:MAG TPA: serine/threonine-protein kinase [Isosphaeraceae bacterium]|jgi:serine/threonine protein kinase|nr:serine/threonine-protein kinase [Isosphaeraceae bacterium]